MISFLIQTIGISVLFLVVAWAVRDIEFDSFKSLFIAAAVFGLVNRIVLPLVLAVSLPLIYLTAGLALVFINALMLKLTSVIVPGFRADGVLAPVLASVVMVVTILLGFYLAVFIPLLAR